MKRQPLATAGLAALLLGIAPVAYSDVKTVWLGVEGATCPKCGFSLAKSLHATPGVLRAWIVVKPQHMEVRLEPGAWVDPNLMLKLTRKSNLKAVSHDIRLTVTGTVAERGSQVVLVLDQMKSSMELPLVSHASAPERARELAGVVGKRLELEGFWMPEGSGGLAVRSFKPIKNGTSVPE